MRIFVRTLVLIVLFAVLGLSAAAVYFRFLLPRKSPPLALKIPPNPERIARGKYIFHAVSACGDCHSGRDLTLVGGPFLPGSTGQGMVLPFEGLPGRVVATNITPDVTTGIGSWSDGEKIRAIRDGISKVGHPLFPLMPYASYRFMGDDDAESLVAYLDSLPSIKNALPTTSLTFPVSLLIRSAPQPAGQVPTPARSDTSPYGEYLSTLGDCMGCHTQEDHGKLRADQKFSGGKEFASPIGRVISANISPDRATGIGSWTEDVFIERFKAYQRTADKAQTPATSRNFTVMPWLSFSQMDPSDLRAIFRYLQTQPPIHNQVTIHPQ